MGEKQKEELPLPEAVSHLLEECRMVLPGIQALFGFQLIVVFNQGFSQKLSDGEQLVHLCAITFVGLAVALVMAPAAYHRQAVPLEVSFDFVALATRLLLWSMFPLMVGTTLDFYLIARVITNQEVVAGVLAAVMAASYLTLWFLLPRIEALRKLMTPKQRRQS